jgi:hypothetical protein
MLYVWVLRAFASKDERHTDSGPVMPLLRDGAGQEGPREAVVDDEGGVDVNR